MKSKTKRSIKLSEERLAGVSKCTKKDGSFYYRASLTVNNKHISLGSYSDACSAHKAYCEACELLKNEQISILDYSDQNYLSFEKWVSMINLRDNLIYISNPIYIRPKMFYYYISPDFVLKFDVEDLFYYSSHKIMKRGNHLFVADYGMQVNLANRYGIRNHAKLGLDYRFLNNDTTDFRYSNIEIFNSYYGIRIKKQNNRVSYKAVINIPGDYVIGYYDSLDYAAIAYNKAVDIVHSKGYPKEYNLNFLDHIPAKKYAEIYTNLRISSKILNLPDYK